ncbi:YfbR-like 5'-deoxynucleotidase [Acidocella sp. MX-AZ02]|uniref:YfbR-like 5'-deoxynucleotidase n=1 Tax=Acidocella sp. MX-AZ02 TaxID=1214225 RepID=UPI00028E18A0|nr:YfbR-like 5'-deoxynucleotidase [Acidocella sp. MX-AZ02]EKN01099.1 hypothetical protein MXAZACID_02299 [Acidocella sp. MX-AZ02]
MRPEILTATGVYFSLVRPDPDDIRIEDIAHALANTCRFAGHCQPFYSVAEHSVRVALCSRVPSWLKFDALMHDAAEAYLGDIPTPLKRLVPEFREVERRIEDAIEARFGCHQIHHELVKAADLALLATERRDLMPAADNGEWEVTLSGIDPLPARITPMSPRTAARLFLEAFEKHAPLDLLPLSVKVTA